MRQFLTIYEYEIKGYIKNKAFMISSVIIILLLFGATFLGRIPAVGDLIGDINDEGNGGGTSVESLYEEDVVDDNQTLGIYDPENVLGDREVFSKLFTETDIKDYKNVDSMKKDVENEKIDGGIYIEGELKYEYFVMNASLYDMNEYAIDTTLNMLHKMNYCEEHNIDFEEFSMDYDAVIDGETTDLGKSAEDNYWYCYILIILTFIVIIMYGQMIATNVTVEKSNRSIEVLVTTVNINSLLFAKVFAGVTAAIVQVGTIIAATLGGYAINREYWGGMLDMIFDIPPMVIACFAIFGIGGIIFYSCLYAAMGALVSKTEDVNKSTSSVQMVVMIVYFASLGLLAAPDSIALKILSYLPISSYTCMFMRAGMGKVEIWEVVVSAIILYVSIFGAGWIAAKIYRMGTLRYGNQIKLLSAIKEIKKSELL